MKFAKDLEKDLVPEWRVKYFDYKAGKKHVKSIERIISKSRPSNSQRLFSISLGSPQPMRGNSPSYCCQAASKTDARKSWVDRSPPPREVDSDRDSEDSGVQHKFGTPMVAKQKLLSDPPSVLEYGSFAPTTSGPDSVSLELPGPALRSSFLDPPREKEGARNHSQFNAAGPPPGKISSLTWSPNDVSGAGHRSTGRDSVLDPVYRQFSIQPAQFTSGASEADSGHPIKTRSSAIKSPEIHLSPQLFSQLKSHEAKFFRWMNKELDKIELFYRSKEDEAGEQLDDLRVQLHIMADMRLEAANRKREIRDGRQFQNGSSRDYIRKTNRISDSLARNSLKRGLREFYRSLELLKSYALLNLTAFRKINKKYDKAVDAHPRLRYTSEKVKNAWFVQSDVLENYMHVTEDLYARYFEEGRHKAAMGKLRCLRSKPGDYTGSSFRSGVGIGFGFAALLTGLANAYSLLNNSDPETQQKTSFLLQIYAGYFLALYLFGLFCLCCRIWSTNRVNYVFIFELDPRHHLDWRELLEFVAIFTVLLSIIVWVNFGSHSLPGGLFIYYPLIFLAIGLALLFTPLRTFYWRSRKWFAYSHLRLLLSGCFPVEFRDFFLGDMYCSLTYFIGNIELCFCLYRYGWEQPFQCGSTNSRLLGFFTALPGIWRVCQCLRRYYDTREVFPHLPNCGKYTITILYYVTLSMYRVNKTRSLLASFIIVAIIGTLYCCFWDIAMDWSLCQPNSRKWLLRDSCWYKRRYYYMAIVADIVLRFNWVLYIIFTGDVPHSSLISFLVAFSEVTRRGIWMLFRLENEHCANVSSFKASRVVPLPYPRNYGAAGIFRRSQAGNKPPEQEQASNQGDVLEQGEAPDQEETPGLTFRHTVQGSATLNESLLPGVERRKTLTDMLSSAHTHDFEKRRRSRGQSILLNNGDHDESDDSRDGSDDSEAEDQRRMEVRMMLN